MKLEQELPNKPNFLLIVLLSGAFILAVFLFLIFVLHWDAHGLLPHHVATPATHNS